MRIFRYVMFGIMALLALARGGFLDFADDIRAKDAEAHQRLAEIQATTSTTLRTSTTTNAVSLKVFGWGYSEWDSLVDVIWNDPDQGYYFCEGWETMYLDERVDATILGWNMAASDSNLPAKDYMTKDRAILYVGLQTRIWCSESQWEVFKEDLYSIYGAHMVDRIAEAWADLELHLN